MEYEGYRRRRYISRQGGAILLIISGIIFLIYGIIDEVTYQNKVVDYHSLTSQTVVGGKYVEGTIDKWAGPYNSSTDGSKIYLLLLDNNQIIPFISDNEEQQELLASYNGVEETDEEIKMTAEAEDMGEQDRQTIQKMLVSSGFSAEQAQKILVSSYLRGYDKPILSAEFKLAIVLGVAGIALFLPEFAELMGRSGARREEFEPKYYNYNTSGYKSTYSATRKTYGEAQGMNNQADFNTQPFEQADYNQQNSQNEEYTNYQYTAPAQNRTYTKNQ